MNVIKIVNILFFILICFMGLNAQGQLKCNEACSCLSIPAIADVMQWNGKVKNYSGGFWRTSSCEYVYKFENLKLIIENMSSRSMAKQDLSNEYEDLIRKGEEGMFYTEEETGDGYQTIYGHGHDRQNRHTVVLRRRWGQEKEVRVRLFTKEEDHKVIKSQLKELLDLMID